MSISVSLSTLKCRLSSFHTDPSPNCTGLTSNVTVPAGQAMLLVNRQASLLRTRRRLQGPAHLLPLLGCRRMATLDLLYFHFKKYFLFSLVSSSTLCRTPQPATSTNQRRAVMSESPIGETIPSAACPIEMLDEV